MHFWRYARRPQTPRKYSGFSKTLMYTVLVVVQVVLAVGLIGLILIQHGKGADAGAAFGSGASGTVFGSRGSASFLSRSTGALATLFFVISLVLAILVARGTAERQSLTVGIEDAAPAETALDAPAIAVESQAVPPAEE